MAHLGDAERIRRALAALGGSAGETLEEARGASETALCRPWSRLDFAERLQSYSSGTWFAKPEAIDPMVCARHGWLNSGMDTLRCLTCAQKLQFGFGGLSYDDAEAAAANFARHLNVGHLAACPWRGAACPSAFAHFPHAAAPDLAAAFQARRAALAKAPHLDARRVDAPAVLTSALAAAAAASADPAGGGVADPEGGSGGGPSGLAAAGAAAAEGEAAAATHSRSSDVARLSARDGDGVAALFGWQPAAPAGHVRCALCGRCAPLASSDEQVDPRPVAAAPADGARAAASAAGGPKRARVGAPFDAEGAHRWFCPWVRAAAAAPATGSAATKAAAATATGSPFSAPSAPGWQRVLAALAAPPEKSVHSSANAKPRPEALAALASARAVLRNI